ncbi:MAG: hypothetical protein H0W95_06845 [Nocardioidaceae bacterium]|nr:hypothetical protein [Nocardioidaceae bacterium]
MTSARRDRWALVLAVALPAVVLGTAGLFHPAHLTDADAEGWRNIHIVALPLFPLLALGPWLLARRMHRLGGVVALLLGYVYACFYTGLDLLAGAGAGALKLEGSEDLGVLFRLASPMEWVGTSAYLAGTVLACALVLRRAGLAAVPGALIVVAASVSFLDSHIFWPRGVLTMYALGFGWAALAAVVRQPTPQRHSA